MEKPGKIFAICYLLLHGKLSKRSLKSKYIPPPKRDYFCYAALFLPIGLSRLNENPGQGYPVFSPPIKNRPGHKQIK
jgi:hypothetical protein